jgi:hypothetical protein
MERSYWFWIALEFGGTAAIILCCVALNRLGAPKQRR